MYSIRCSGGSQQTLVYYSLLLPACLPTSSRCGVQVLQWLISLLPPLPVLPVLPTNPQAKNEEQTLLFLTVCNSPLLRTLPSLFQQLSTPKFTQATEFLSALPTSSLFWAMLYVDLLVSLQQTMGVHAAPIPVYLGSPAWTRVLITGP